MERGQRQNLDVKGTRTKAKSEKPGQNGPGFLFAFQIGDAELLVAQALHRIELRGPRRGDGSKQHANQR